MTIISNVPTVSILKKPHIYILKDIGNKALKIGYSLDCDRRFMTHNTANPFLKLIAIIPVKNQAVEQKLHKRMLSFRIPQTREWYVDTLFFRNLLDVFFVLENIVEDSIIDLTTKFLPDVSDSFNSYIPGKISEYYYQKLIVRSWLEEKPMAEIAGEILASGLDDSDHFCYSALARIAKTMGLSTEALKTGILNGTIAPLSSHHKD